MMDSVNFVFDILMRVPLWLLSSLPLIWLLHKVAQKLKNKTVLTHFAYCTVCALLLVPAPVGMFLALVPLAYVALSSPEYFQKVWAWLAIGYPITFLLVFISTRSMFGKAHNKLRNSDS